MPKASSTTSQLLTAEQARKIVEPFYDMLTHPATKDIRAISEQIMAADWISFSSETESKGRDGLIKLVTHLGEVVPNLTFTIKEVLVAGDRIVVRTEATGTPVGTFLGIPPTGRSFAMMAIDIHTLRDGLLASGHHVEDWAGAIRQLKHQA